MLKEAISLLVEGKSLSTELAADVMEEIMSGEATPAQIGAFVTALRIKGETEDEITGLAKTMRVKAIPVKVDGLVLDIVGTGGDNSGTFNISTASALVAASAGLKVAKHGNRAMSSNCGSADVLEALGVKIDLPAAQVQKCIQEIGIGFMFAPVFHPAMKHAAAPRREIGIRTVFNILGPLTNPAGAKSMVLGVASKELLDKMASVLQNLGCYHAMVVHGEDGLDEITITGKTIVREIRDKGIESYDISPKDLGLQTGDSDSLKGGSAAENADIVRKILAGSKGPQRDAVLMNTSAALLVGEKVKTLQDGVSLSQDLLDSGRALNKLEQFIELSQNLSK
jgi:anthranilate phosphoribosyltransferase